MRRYVLVDTSALLGMCHDRDPACVRTVVRLLCERRLVATSVVVAETLGGDTTPPGEQAWREKVVGWLRDVLPLSEGAARLAALVRRHRRRHDQDVPDLPDALIAATAAEYALPVLTINRRDFQGLPGVELFPMDD